MTTMTFISMVIALILVIVAIARVQGSPKLGINLMLTLAFAIVVGFGFKAKLHSEVKKQDQIEKVSKLNYEPIQALQIIGVTPVMIAAYKLVGQVYIQPKDKDQQQTLITNISKNVREPPTYQNSS